MEAGNAILHWFGLVTLAPKRFMIKGRVLINSGLLMVHLLCCAVLTTDEEFIERETYLNCVKNAMGVLDLLEHCFIDVGRRDVVAQFVSAGRNAATCSFESCIRKVIDALRTALETANALTGKAPLGLSCMPIDG